MSITVLFAFLSHNAIRNEPFTPFSQPSLKIIGTWEMSGAYGTPEFHSFLGITPQRKPQVTKIKDTEILNNTQNRYDNDM